MKQLLLVRHGKAESPSAAIKDTDRALTRTGHQDAPEMANRFVEKGVIPEYLISSTANRALTTAKYFAKVWNIEQEKLRTEASIYEASIPALLKAVNLLDNQYERIALFGHNPGFTEFANYLSNADIYNIPPAGLVWIEFPFDDWALVSQATGTLLLFDYPRDPNE
jgi:phosphohistidine phosphatase